MSQVPGDSPIVQEKRRRLSWGCFVCSCILGLLGILFFRVVNLARESARQSSCQGRLNQLYHALRSYHDVYDSFPPAFVADANGKPMHSWRVLILPFINEAVVYEEYDFNEPWDGTNNRKLADRIFNDLFHCPSGPHFGESPMTDYVVITGAGTAFPGSMSTSLDDMCDGPGNTILLVEIADSTIHWMEPRDLMADEMSFVVNDTLKSSISSPHSRGPAVVFADRIKAYRIQSSVRPQTLKALTTIAGEEDISKEGLARFNKRTGWHLAE